MKTFEKILIAVDESKYSYHAAKYGFELANKLNADIALVHINQIPMAINVTGDPILGNSEIVFPNILEIQDDAAKKLISDIISKYSNGKNVTEYILTGNVRDEIIEVAKSYNASLIIMGTHGRTGFDHFFSGSVAEDVIKKAKCPVLIVPNKHD
jgi:nucleotide-binding universal stress UspA family protein